MFLFLQWNMLPLSVCLTNLKKKTSARKTYEILCLTSHCKLSWVLHFQQLITLEQIFSWAHRTPPPPPPPPPKKKKKKI